MGNLDIFKSLIRSAARSASVPLSRSEIVRDLRKQLASYSFLTVEVTDQTLTAAIGRISQVAAATVRISQGQIAVQLDTVDGRSHGVSFSPHSISFAPRGAKELTFRVTPPEVANQGMTLDACGAIAGELARAIWHPILRNRPPSQHLAFVHCSGDLLTADLRTVPEVRAAGRSGLTANLMDALSLAHIDPVDGKLILRLGVISL